MQSGAMTEKGLVVKRRTRMTGAVAAIAMLIGGTAACTETSSPPPAPATESQAPSGPTSSTRTARPTSSPTTKPPARIQTVTVGGSGDILIHKPVRDVADRAVAEGYLFDPMFAQVKEIIGRSDVALCHQETPISDDNTWFPRAGTLTYVAPRELAEGLTGAGFDGCSTASNHLWDNAAKGLRTTKATMDKAGLKRSGPGDSAEDVGRWPVFTTRSGLTVAHLSFTYSLLNMGQPNTEVPPGEDWLEAYSWPIRKPAGIIAVAREQRRLGADVVVVSMHWGSEYETTPTKDQRAYAKELLESGEVDLILGAHAHVVQTCEKINGRYVVYGMGNFLSNQSSRAGIPVATQDGVYVEAKFTRKSGGKISSSLRYAPTWVNIGKGFVIERATPSQHPESHARTVAQMEQCGATLLP